MIGNICTTRKDARRRLSPGAFLFAVLGLAALASTSNAQQIKVLFWGGGSTAHTPKNLRDTLVAHFAPLSSVNIQITYRADSTNEPVWIHPDTLAQYDVLLAYTTNQDASKLGQARLNDLVAWVNSGRVIVALHGSTNTYLNNNATVAANWRALMGGQFTDHAPDNNGGVVSLTTAGSAHASLAGTTMLPASGAATGNAPYWDEGRRHNQFAADTVVLARSQIGTVNVPWIWVRPQGKGWVYYTASGHDGQVWKMSEFKGQIRRALEWGYAVKQASTGVRGFAPENPFLRLDACAGRLAVPLRATHTLEVFDLGGRRLLFEGPSTAESHDISALPAGTYGVRLHPVRGDALRALLRVE
jgi:type 1 glutamine amidotransferase